MSFQRYSKLLRRTCMFWKATQTLIILVLQSQTAYILKRPSPSARSGMVRMPLRDPSRTWMSAWYMRATSATSDASTRPALTAASATPATCCRRTLSLVRKVKRRPQVVVCLWHFPVVQTRKAGAAFCVIYSLKWDLRPGSYACQKDPICHCVLFFGPIWFPSFLQGLITIILFLYFHPVPGSYSHLFLLSKGISTLFNFFFFFSFLFSLLAEAKKTDVSARMNS